MVGTVQRRHDDRRVGQRPHLPAVLGIVARPWDRRGRGGVLAAATAGPDPGLDGAGDRTLEYLLRDRDDRRLDRVEEPATAVRRGAAGVHCPVLLRQQPGGRRPRGLMPGTVIVPIDGSALSRLALPAASAVAAAGSAGLRLVAIARDDGELEESRDRVREAAESLPVGTTAELDTIVNDDPVGALLDITSDPTNVLCLGSHDHSHPVSSLLGSVGSKVVEQSSQPFIIVGPNGTSGVLGSDVAVALDGGDEPDPLLATAVTWAIRLDAPLRIVTVFEPVPPDIRRPDHYTRRLGPPSDPDRYLDAMRQRA